MTEHPTLRSLSGLPLEPASLAESTLIMIDCQNTYTQGVMELDGVQAALDEAATLLERARVAGIPIIHIQHNDGPGSLYDLETYDVTSVFTSLSSARPEVTNRTFLTFNAASLAARSSAILSSIGTSSVSSLAGVIQVPLTGVTGASSTFRACTARAARDMTMA